MHDTSSLNRKSSELGKDERDDNYTAGLWLSVRRRAGHLRLLMSLIMGCDTA